jgi:hypothetical protein
MGEREAREPGSNERKRKLEGKKRQLQGGREINGKRGNNK